MLTPAERLLALTLRRELLALRADLFDKPHVKILDFEMDCACENAMSSTGMTAESIQDFVDRFSYGDLHGNRFIEFLDSVE